MRQFFSKITSFILAFLVLLSTLSFAVDKHYCGDFLVDVSFTGEAQVCGLKMENTSLTKKKNCCKDEVHKFDGQDELQNHKVENITFKNEQFLTAFIILFKGLNIENNADHDFYKDFSPPDIPLNYQILYQYFLI
ncbi:hypothetical protein K8354_07730 [Polaribacter litorisediminis]|uniref:HYC_CC_PP family protein n=1 Tax=Polaribacter litorisediminis TaxID=1908341 RepID=UPI001CC13CEE|nr:hypothetical protein [Polaribacter litorisediminis]UAM99684.1 hypothetical protein K8354_07730 [Polaribacter litorisediminis]